MTSPVTQLFDDVRSTLPSVGTVLDIGAGIRPQTVVQCQKHILVDPYFPYLQRVKWERPNDPKMCYVHADWYALVHDISDPEPIDAIVLLDVIEHLEKPDGARLLHESLVRWKPSLVVIYAPNGFLEQNPIGKDAWGMDGAEWQQHKSGWIPDDFPGWRIHMAADQSAFFAVVPGDRKP